MPSPAPRHLKTCWLVDILRCFDGSLYTGITNDLPSGQSPTLPTTRLDELAAASGPDCAAAVQSRGQAG